MLKAALVNAPILGYPDRSEPFYIESDASGIGVGAVWSRVLTTRERNFDTRERECLAAVEAMKHWRSYLHGAQIVLFTDHASLRYLLEAKNLSGRLARWALTLIQYNPEIKHRPGTSLVVPHTLSHFPLEQQPVLTVTKESALQEYSATSARRRCANHR